MCYRPAVPLLALAAICGATTALHAQSLLSFEVSPALQEQWSSTLTAQPGGTVDVRLRISYTGTAAPLGFAAVSLQPTVSNWSSLNGDHMQPLVNNGVGSQGTTPIGAVTDSPGAYGRVIPYAISSYTSTTRLTGHVNTISSVQYLRVAAANATNWFGGAGNTGTSLAGVNLRQLNDIGRIASDPPFSPQLQNIVMFKFAVTLSSSLLEDRVMEVTAPSEGIWNWNLNVHGVAWFASMSETRGSIVTSATVTPASIHVVPAPAGPIALAAGAFLGLARQRKRHFTV